MTILTTGATGTVGRHLVRLLRAQGAPVRALVRNRDRAADLLGPDLDLAVGDFADRASLAAAVDGVTTVYLACANHPAQVAWETALIDAAVVADVQRIVKLSAIDAAVGSPVAFADAHGRIQEHLGASGVDHVLLKPGFMMTNLLAAAHGVHQAGAIFLPGAGAKVAMIDPRDIAEVAAVALTGEVARELELTGPAAVTFDDVAEQVGVAAGRRVDFVSIPDDVAVAQLIGMGAPEWFATNLVTQFGLLRSGAQAEARDTVRTVLGREPRSIAGFVRDHADAFAAVPR
jgi:uncharacterized protein YbjT (DUF2867 family)